MGIRVVVAEDSLRVREGVCRLLDHQPDIEVVGACGDLPELLAAVDLVRRGRARVPAPLARHHASGRFEVMGTKRSGEGMAVARCTVDVLIVDDQSLRDRHSEPNSGFRP